MVSPVLIYPINCNGYCLIEAKPDILDDNNLPPSLANYTTSDVAKKLGWTTTKNIKFSYDKSVVWLCPDCTKRWQQESAARIKNIISGADGIKNKQQFINATIELQKLDATKKQMHEFDRIVYENLHSRLK